MISSFYQMQRPTSWAKAPEIFSFSTLKLIESCPLRWQLENSDWPEFGRYPCRPFAAAIEGQIIHAGLEGLFRCMGLAGLPEMDSPEFYQEAASFNLGNLIEVKMQEHLDEIARHPRGHSFRFERKKQHLINETINTFRNVYKPEARLPKRSPHSRSTQKSAQNPVDYAFLLSQHKYLSEIYIAAEPLQLAGIIDTVFIEQDRLVIADFKTGAQQPEHLDQLQLYALLWHSATGQVADELRLIYPGATVSHACSPEQLKKVSKALQTRITAADTELAANPAAGRLSDNCRHCSVRQVCTAYWQSPHIVRKKSELKKKAATGSIDLAVTFLQSPGETGSLVSLTDGTQLPIVWESTIGSALNQLKKDASVRILNSIYDSDSKSLFLKPSSEVFLT